MQALLIGIGNEYRCDDAVGLYVARHVRERASGVVVRESSGDGLGLLDDWNIAEMVVLVDAVCSGSEAGKIHRIESHSETLPTELFQYSTHAFSVAQAVELARILNQLPPRLVVYGIEGRNFDAGIGLTAEVKLSAERVIDCVLEDLIT